jgi:hypothetical protein
MDKWRDAVHNAVRMLVSLIFARNQNDVARVLDVPANFLAVNEYSGSRFEPVPGYVAMKGAIADQERKKK